MININKMPCSNCKHFCGVSQKDGTEATEHIVCSIAAGKKAENLLKVDGKSIKCERQDKYDD